MIYRNFQDKNLSLLGFGAMRLPEKDGVIDEETLKEMMDHAIANGINYFDTAYPYHGGQSERVLGRLLKHYPRESFYLATKFPGHQISDSYDPSAIFEEQLEKCGVEYFDFYLLHNVCESSIATYQDPQWGIIDYFKEQKRLGRIRHLGFSSHGRLDNLRKFLDKHGDDMEFCQIQLNYLDWSLQNAKAKYELLTERNIPVWVMEPVRGGKLVNLPETDIEKLKNLRPDASAASWGFRFLMGLPNVGMILSGMSNMEQMTDNVKTFSSDRPLSDPETELLFEIAEGMKDSVPCTACRYCCDGCPQGLDIPTLISVYNETKISAGGILSMYFESLPEDKRPDACIGCGLCTHSCPQQIDVPQVMKDLAETVAKLPSWSATCRQKDEAARKK